MDVGEDEDVLPVDTLGNLYGREEALPAPIRVFAWLIAVWIVG